MGPSRPGFAICIVCSCVGYHFSVGGRNIGEVATRSIWITAGVCDDFYLLHCVSNRHVLFYKVRNSSVDFMDTMVYRRPTEICMCKVKFGFANQFFEEKGPPFNV